MKIEELDEELKNIAESVTNNWDKCEEPNAIPEIVSFALNNFRKSIIKYLKEKEG